MADVTTDTATHPLPPQEILSVEDGKDKNCAFTEEELELARQNPGKAATKRPSLLGYVPVVFIIVNRMIGTGIFRSPTIVAHGTHSVAYSLIFWALGGVVAVSGAHVFAEFGLTIPRLEVTNEGKQFVPRNGGEKNYLEFFYKKPLLLATCMYGIPFIMMGNTAGNSLLLSEAVLGANGQIVNDWAMRGVAIGVITFSCALHAIWRNGGIYLSNIFGAVKVGILFAIFVFGAAYAGGKFHGSGANATANLNVHTSTADAGSSPYSYAEAFLAILFTFGGFNQASYVLGEVEDCRNRFKVTTITTVSCISVLFFLVNLAYMFVVPKADQFASGEDTVARNFFRILFGPVNGPRVQYSLMAFSALGNIIVQTFTGARVKQEIAKEGILPFGRLIANNYSITPEWLRSKKSTDSQDTPVGALVLHWIFAVILILSTRPAKRDSYPLLVYLYAFTIDAFFRCLVGLSLLILRTRIGAKWSGIEWSKVSSSNFWVSVVTAFILFLANLFPLITIWFPPSRNNPLALTGTWYLVGTVGTSLIGFAFLYWLLLHYIIPIFRGKELEVDRQYNYIKDHGHWVMWHEIVSFKWKAA